MARRAGVSIATASRAFGEPERLAAATRERVMEAAADLGYANPQAGTATRTFGVIVPDVANPVYGKLLKAIESQAWHGRHRIVLFDADEDLRREREQIEQARRLDGMLLCSPRLPDAEVIALIGTSPAVIINRQIDGVPCVIMDAVHGPSQAIEHLVALGHEHIAYASGPQGSWADARRFDTIAAACEHHGIRLTRLSHHAASIQGGRAAAALAAASGATAVVAYNDLVALGLEAGMLELGRSCPDDISLVGIDDIDLAGAVTPALTTVQMPIERSGALAVDLLLQAIAGTVIGDVVTLGSQLIVRASTGVARAA
ncbi:LacI family transcriptional regulator [Microbacterium sp. zg.Y625]|uniref:LacI family DNA-binding transcriptional regulator n=1 Tax=Microbacterium jiangjiandongii TaxID=3049071 RepID=UPI00214AAF49|nr:MULTISPECIES: LacI family DNA-binding transcriptional regulator [unclassified Microbacterium]MCR2792392.1 LacI family transcriptional regulator [Microbacterium sp. zg.Y625]MCR2816880.1 LacI family transcriptional regulator [Microbacterium sp. zg.Y843]WIM26389.1 LacI family DNA-binding transcriptional regulator [Microbacterium sp. zg-Y625]